MSRLRCREPLSPDVRYPTSLESRFIPSQQRSTVLPSPFTFRSVIQRFRELTTTPTTTTKRLEILPERYDRASLHPSVLMLRGGNRECRETCLLIHRAPSKTGLPWGGLLAFCRLYMLPGVRAINKHNKRGIYAVPSTENNILRNVSLGIYTKRNVISYSKNWRGEVIVYFDTRGQNGRLAHCIFTRAVSESPVWPHVANHIFLYKYMRTRVGSPFTDIENAPQLNFTRQLSTRRY